MQQIAPFLQLPLIPFEGEFKYRRDELIKKAVKHINELRRGTPYEYVVETPANLAKRINMNPFLAGKEKDGELEMILNTCRQKNLYCDLYKLLKK